MKVRLQLKDSFVPEFVAFLRAGKKVGPDLLLDCDTSVKCCDLLIRDKDNVLIALRCTSTKQQASKVSSVLTYFDCAADPDSSGTQPNHVYVRMPIDLLLDAVETSTGESPLSMRLARNEGRTMMLCELSSNGVVARTYVPVEIGDLVNPSSFGARRFRVHQVDMGNFATAADKLSQFSAKTPVTFTTEVNVLPNVTAIAGSITLTSQELVSSLSVQFQMANVELMTDAISAVKLRHVDMLHKHVAERVRSEAQAMIAKRYLGNGDEMVDDNNTAKDKELRDTITAMGYKYRHGEVVVEDSQLPQRTTSEGNRQYNYEGVDMRCQYTHVLQLAPQTFAKLFVLKGLARTARMLIHDSAVAVDGVTDSGCRFRVSGHPINEAI